MAHSILDIDIARWGVDIYPLEDVGITIVFQIEKRRKDISQSIERKFSTQSEFQMVLLALFGAVMGQGVIWYTGQFYAQTFLEKNRAS